MPTTVEELNLEIHRLRMMNALMEREIAQANAKADAMTGALSSEDGKSDSQKAKTRRQASSLETGPTTCRRCPHGQGTISLNGVKRLGLKDGGRQCCVRGLKTRIFR